MPYLIEPSLVPYAQIVFATLLGMLLGIERAMSGRTAGPRTYGLVAMAACLISLISVWAAGSYGAYQNSDPFHLLAAIVTGVGFIGAGLIIFKGTKLSGLTTAAGIWVSAAIGIAVGLQFYSVAAFSTFLTLFLFTVMRRIELKIKDFGEEHPEG